MSIRGPGKAVECKEPSALTAVHPKADIRKRCIKIFTGGVEGQTQYKGVNPTAECISILP